MADKVEIVVIDVRLKGVTPLMMDRFTDEAAQQITDSDVKKVMTGKKFTPEQICKKALYVDEKGNPAIPSVNVHSMLVEAGYLVKVNGKQATTQSHSWIPGGLTVLGVWNPVLAKNNGRKVKPKWNITGMKVVNQKTRGAVMVYRPVFYTWELGFKVQVDPEIFDEAFVRRLVDVCGKQIGLGSWRPYKKGPYGKFRVECWEPKYVAV